MKKRTITFGALLALVLLVGATPTRAQAPPAAVAPTTWRSVSAGFFHTCAIRSDRDLFCWGANQQGQLGTGGEGSAATQPLRVSASSWIAVAAGGLNTCAIRSDHRLFCWGDDESGQVGDGGASDDRLRPTPVAGGATDWTAVTVGAFHACGLRSRGRLFCWGNDALGQVGDGPGQTNRAAPVRVSGTFLSVDAGANHTCAIRTSGELTCWGDDSAGQLGNGGLYGSVGSPFVFDNGGRRWSQVAAGEWHTCARTRTGRAFCWGEDGQDQLGNGTSTATHQSPVPVDDEERYAGIGAGSAHTCARSVNGEAFCWGSDGAGQQGNGPSMGAMSTPSGVRTPASGNISVGAYHACNRTTAGRLQCWGDNSRGQLGVASSQQTFQAPVRVDVLPG